MQGVCMCERVCVANSKEAEQLALANHWPKHMLNLN